MIMMWCDMIYTVVRLGRKSVDIKLYLSDISPTVIWSTPLLGCKSVDIKLYLSDIVPTVWLGDLLQDVERNIPQCCSLYVNDILSVQQYGLLWCFLLMVASTGIIMLFEDGVMLNCKVLKCFWQAETCQDFRSPIVYFTVFNGFMLLDL